MNGDLTLNKDRTRVKFPRIAIKLRPGTLTVRETEKILDERVIQRTQEVPSPTTGIPKLQTIEYVEKIIEKEVRFCFRT